MSSTSSTIPTLLLPAVLLLAGCGTAPALMLAAGCSGRDQGSTEGYDRTLNATLDVSDLSATWPVIMADDATRAPYQTNRGWATHLTKRRYVQAAQQFGAEGGLATARTHADAANLFRQAALLSANSLIQTYGETPEPTDPVGTAHLLSVSYALNGDLKKARKYSKKLEGIDDPSVAWHAPWKAWLAGDASWPPDLSGLPLENAKPTPGAWPNAGNAPHYRLPIVGDETRKVEMGDPGVLVALAMWHDKAAKKAAGDQKAVVKTYSGMYRLPAEGPVKNPVDMPMEFLFGSDLLVPGDGPFMADLHNPAIGAGAVAKHIETSQLAALAAASRKDKGTIDPELAGDNIAKLRQALVDQQAAKTHNTIQGHHRLFADVSRAGALRMLALVAEVEGDRETSGKLRIAAYEATEMAASCPVGQMALGAWDASNRYPLRAQDIVHNQLRRYPSLETARYALDVMALRVSRERVGEGAQ